MCVCTLYTLIRVYECALIRVCVCAVDSGMCVCVDSGVCVCVDSGVCVYIDSGMCVCPPRFGCEWTYIYTCIHIFINMNICLHV